MGPETVATFKDPNGADKPDHYWASIDWGDASASDGTITYDGATDTFTVRGQHQYAEEGRYTIDVTITHTPPPAAALGPLTPVAVSQGLDGPIGIDYHFITKSLILSDHYRRQGPPMGAFERVRPDGTLEALAAPNFFDEVKIAAVRENCFPCFFSPGDLFSGTGGYGQIFRSSDGGRTFLP